MQKSNNPTKETRGPLGIRISVWLICCSLLTCVLLVKIPSSPARQSRERLAQVGETAAHDDFAPAARRNQTIQATPSLPTVAEAVTRSAQAEASAGISNELSVAREKLQALRGSYGEQHPEVKEQVQAVESLERSSRTGETLELARARAELARLEVRFGPDNSERQEQVRFVESLEQSATASDSSELAQAKAQLAKLRTRYGEEHPAVQAQLKRVAEVQQ